MTTLVSGSFIALRKNQLLWNAYEGYWDNIERDRKDRQDS
jgi:hypothetical protein